VLAERVSGPHREDSSAAATPGNHVDVSPIEREPPACIREPENPNESEHEIERHDHECEAQQNATVQSYRTTGPDKRPVWEE
jgi:hypothetical protein